MKDISKRKAKLDWGDADGNNYGLIFKRSGLIQPIDFRSDLMFDYGGETKLIETKKTQINKYELELTNIYETVIHRWIPDIYKKPVQIVKHKIPVVVEPVKADSIKEIPEAKIILPDKISFLRKGEMYFMFDPDSAQWKPIAALTYYVAEANGENILIDNRK